MDKKEKLHKRLYVMAGYLIMFAIGFVMAGRQLVLPDIMADFAMGNTGVGIFVALQSAAVLMTNLTFSGLTDRINKKLVIGIFGIISTVGAFLGYFSAGIFVVGLSVFVFGIGFAIVNGTMAATLLETEPEKSSKFTNITQIFYSVGAVAAPVILSWMLEGGMH
ncbi:MAG: MFS transporter, partial [Christensenellaceae bacterium]|nr:MFS transporter [Christensenellaceae bacterium]